MVIDGLFSVTIVLAFLLVAIYIPVFIVFCALTINDAIERWLN